MNTSVKTQLRVLAFQSLLVMVVYAAFPVINHLEGKKAEPNHFAFMFIGIIGVITYEIIKKLSARIEKLEAALSER